MAEQASTDLDDHRRLYRRERDDGAAAPSNREEERETEDRPADRDEPPAKRKPAGERDEDAAQKDDGQDGNEEGDEGDDDEGPTIRDRLHTWRGKIVAGGILLVLVVAVTLAILWWLDARQYESTKNAYIAAPVVDLSPGVSGHIARIHVRNNETVQAGQPLLTLAGGGYEVSLSRAQAEVSAADAQAAQARASVEVAAAEQERAQREVNRLLSVSAAARAGQELDAAQAALRSANARVTQAEADVQAAEARREQAAAALSDAQLNQRDTVLLAPITGQVTNFDAVPGDYVTTGQPVLALVGRARWVDANFKEDQLQLMRPGQPVTVTIDAFSGFELPAHVESFQVGTGAEFSLFPPQNATGNWVETTQRVPVRIRFEEGAFSGFPSEAPVLPGMSVQVKAKVR
ncbi:HlyD family secretion protein [Parvularcula dongshanensis]|uniref:Membrane fusion protein (Multidrug efflux system) n=1 Tax=Parvularcula dongshanensis TaxID=1173995 RepID=A0A840I464_9PROT|nr:HlyD family secretion protein [Parvularcula dongshanensis]MBB4659659.1 membrane fusion protein (multidrug efflux system) [Parvularcula dongshanensis]